MKRKLFLTMMALLFCTGAYAQGTWPINDMWLKPPAVGSTAHHENRLKIMLWRANKRHPEFYYRYQPHISNREYIDCSYFKYVDCSNFEYCRCWQCKDYVYTVRRINY